MGYRETFSDAEIGEGKLQIWQIFPHMLDHCKTRKCRKAVYWSPSKLVLWEHLLRLSTNEEWRNKVILLYFQEKWDRSDADPLIDKSNAEKGS